MAASVSDQVPCFSPLKGYRGVKFGPSGKRLIVFSPKDAFTDLPISIPCGQCRGCRLERSRVWAVRCMHEASLHEESSFVTLTYDPECLPDGGTLVHRDFQLFMKRLRKSLGGRKIRYFMCGEYGETYGRPHYHAVLFGVGFYDKELYKRNANGDPVFTSKMLDKLWPYGMCTVGAVTWQSASYTARYVMKKYTGPMASLYEGRKPDYCMMSKGVGKGWFDKFLSDVFPHDNIVMNGHKFKVPRYYEKMYELMIDEADYRQLKGKRLRAAKVHASNNTPERLIVRAEVLESRLRNLKRSVE